MGFEAIAALTHAMEDVFELLRQRSGGLPPDAIDVLSACLDALEARGRGGSPPARGERLDPAPLVERLRALARERTPAQELARDGDAALPDLAAGQLARGRRDGCCTSSRSSPTTCQMPAVRAFMLFEALRVHGELVGGVPAPDAVERFAGRRVEAWVATRSDDVHARGERARRRRAGRRARARGAAAGRRARRRAGRRPPPRRASAPARPCASTPSGSTSCCT